MAEILDKTKEWSDRFGGILRASAKTQFPGLYKGAVGGMEHVISVENAGNYLELWREGSAGGELYYATTGAAIKPLPGLAKGARLDEALDRFFVLMTKKSAGGRTQAHQRPQRKAIPKKLKRLAGVRKNIMERADPEIGPSMSVGHRKPSDLSPESSVRKLAKRIIADINRLNKTSAADFTRYAPHGPGKPHIPPSRDCPNCPKKPPVKKNVVALTGNQPGSGRVKPERTRMVQQNGMESKTGTGTYGVGMREGPPKRGPRPGQKPNTFLGKPVGEGVPSSRTGMRPAGWGTPAEQQRGGRMQSKHDTPQSPHKEHMRGGRRGGGVKIEIPQNALAALRDDFERWYENPRNIERREPAWVGVARSIFQEKKRKTDNLEGGRVQPGGGTKPVQPRQSGPGTPSGYAPRTGREFSQRQPMYDYSRYRKACPCNEVAKTMKAVTR